MSYVIKRKLRSAIGGGKASATGTKGSADVGGLTTLIQHIQTSTEGIVTTLPGLMDSLTVNHLVVKKTLKIPALTDGYK